MPSQKRRTAKTEKNTRKKASKKKATGKTSSKSATLFSQREVRNFVIEFTTSWIRGNITIHFPTAAELSKKTPLSIAFPEDPSVNAELKIKEHYIDLLSTCAGIKQASIEEQQQAVSEIFRMLLMFRSANRIEGKIRSNELEKRVEKLEKAIEALTKQREELAKPLLESKEEPK